jgi:hypothetical protein
LTDRKATYPLLAATLVLALAAPGSTQTATAPVAPQPGNTVLIAQYECSPGELGKVDQLLKDVTTPVLNRMVAEGKVMSWGVLGAYVGGPANRTIYVWAKDPVALLQARQVYLPEIMAKPAYAELGRLCPRQQTSLNNMILNPSSK